MNFHKTIGYLAALLLMVGLGAPDSFCTRSNHYAHCFSDQDTRGFAQDSDSNCHIERGGGREYHGDSISG